MSDFFAKFGSKVSPGKVEKVDVQGYINVESKIFLEAQGITALEKVAIISLEPVANAESVVSDGRPAFADYVNAKAGIVSAAISDKGVVKALQTHIKALQGLRAYFSSVLARIPGPTNALPKAFLLQLNVFIDECIVATQAALPVGKKFGLIGTVLNTVVGIVDDVLNVL